LANSLSEIQLAVIGAGNMGQAMLAGAIRAGVLPNNVIATTHDAAAETILTNKYQVSVGESNAAAVANADLVILAVKPDQVSEVLTEISPHLKPTATVVSVAVGLDLATLAPLLANGQPLVRTMPNTPAAVGQGVTAISPAATVNDQQLALVQQVLGGSGAVVVVPEKYQPAVGAISGSGPAYVAYFIDALIEAGVQQGLPRLVATELALNTFEGTAAMLTQTGEHPALARERVTSPGGTTAAALAELDNSAVRAAIGRAVAAAIARTEAIKAAQQPAS